jgi:hypothetical protein
MINFFRKTRKKMADDNKPMKYMRYAIGEILLVVIGILIALSINNWNQSQKEKSIEVQYLVNIIDDLKEQSKSIEIQMDYERTYYETASRIIDYYNINQTFSLDSLFFKDASSLLERKTFVITDPTYTDLISSGNITIIKNKVNKDALLKYYQELERIEKVIQSNNSLLIDQHYNLAFLKNGYYYSNIKEVLRYNIANIPGYVVQPKYHIEVQEISKNVILGDENKLSLLNAVSYRQSIAIGHYALLFDIKSVTQSLINELEISNNDQLL